MRALSPQRQATLFHDYKRVHLQRGAGTGSRKLEAGSWKPEARRRKPEPQARSRKAEAGSQKPEAGEPGAIGYAAAEEFFKKYIERKNKAGKAGVVK